MKNIRNWTDKSSDNKQLFVVYCMIVCNLIWFIPCSIILLSKYGMFKTLPRYTSFIEVALIIISILAGFKFSMWYLYDKKR
jgi:hypothetical protein